MYFSLVRDAKLRVIFFLLALAFLSGALLRPLNGGGDLFDPEFRTVGKETASVQIIGAIVYIASIVLVLWQWRRLRFNKELILTILIILLAMASAYWATESGISIRRSIALAGTTFFGLALALALDRRQVLFVLNLFTVLFFLTTVAMAAVSQEFSFHQAGFASFAGALRGPYNHKNDMGHVVGLLLVIFWMSGRSSMNRTNWTIVVSVGSVLLLATLSVGSLVAAMAGVAGTYMVAKISINPSPLVRMLVWLIVIFVGSILALFWNDLFAFTLEALGRDPTLSDRTLVWDLVILAGKDNWLLGSGYGVAWLGGAADAVKSGLYANINNAHNGFLEIWLQIGVVGVALVVLLMFMALVKLNANFRRNDEMFGRTSMAILIYVAFENVATVHLLTYNDMTWSFIVAVAYLAGRRGQTATRAYGSQVVARTNPTRRQRPLVANRGQLFEGQ